MESSLACKLSTPELQKRKATVIADLKHRISERIEVENGYAYKFPATDETLDKLTEFIKTERLCCDFFTFNMTVGDVTVRLEITGPEGSKKFLDEEIGF